MRVDRIWWRLRTVARTAIAQVETRLRTRGRSALSRAARMTGATVAAFVVAELVGLPRQLNRTMRAPIGLLYLLRRPVD